MEEVIKIEDRSKIGEITFHFPELMNSNAESFIKEKYARMMNVSESIYTLRQQLFTLEEEYKRIKQEWDELKTNFSYTHPTIDKTIIKETCSMTIKGHGNDIIGRTTIV